MQNNIAKLQERERERKEEQELMERKQEEEENILASCAPSYSLLSQISSRAQFAKKTDFENKFSTHLLVSVSVS